MHRRNNLYYKGIIKGLQSLNSDPIIQNYASYKIKFGLGKYIEEKQISDLQETYFSLNIDEATSDMLQKILTAFVSFFFFF